MVCKVKKEYVFGGRRKEKGERRKGDRWEDSKKQERKSFGVVAMVCVECRKKKCILKKEGIASMNFSFLMIK